MKHKRKSPILLILFTLALLAGSIYYTAERLQLFPLIFGSAPDPAVVAFAQENDLSLDAYPVSLVELMMRNPETEEFVLNYPQEKDQTHEVDISSYDTDAVPLFMQWDPQWGYLEYGGELAGLSGCGPVCLSMAAYYLTGNPDMSPDQIIRFAQENGYCTPSNGSKWTLISEGGVKLGLDVTEIPLVKQRMVDNLEVGNPIICVMGPGDFTTTGHFILLRGMEDGKFQVNDPNSMANSQRLWSYEEIQDQIRNLWVLR